MRRRRCPTAEVSGKVSERVFDEAVEAIRRGELSLVQDLVATTPGLVRQHTAHRETLLHVAAAANRTEIVEWLLDEGVEIEAEASWGQTAFEWAANMNAEEAALLLLDRGATRLGLWTAAALGMMDRVKASFDGDRLIEGEGRTPRDGIDLEGWPPDCAFRMGDYVSDAFYIACRNGRMEVARFLRSRGAEIDATGHFGATALHWAAGRGHGEVVDWLIGEGADRKRRDPRFGGDPAGWAREFGHDELAERLRRYSM